MLKVVQSFRKKIVAVLGLLLALQLSAAEQPRQVARPWSWGSYVGRRSTGPAQQPQASPVEVSSVVPALASSTVLSPVEPAVQSPDLATPQPALLETAPVQTYTQTLPPAPVYSWQKPMPATYEELEPTRAPEPVRSWWQDRWNAWRAGSQPINNELEDAYSVYKKDLAAERAAEKREQARRIAEQQAWEDRYEKDLAVEKRDRALFTGRFAEPKYKSRYDHMLAQQEQHLVVSQATEMLRTLNQKEAQARKVIAENSGGMFSNLFRSPSEQILRDKRVGKAKEDLNRILTLKEKVDTALGESSVKNQLAELEYVQKRINSEPVEFSFEKLEELDREKPAASPLFEVGSAIEREYPKASPLAAIIASGIDKYLKEEEATARAQVAAGGSDARLNEILGYKSEFARALNQEEEADQLNMLQSLAEGKIDQYRKARAQETAEEYSESAQPAELNLLEPMAPGEGESMPARVQAPAQVGQEKRGADMLHEQETMISEQRAQRVRERAAQEFGRALAETREPKAPRRKESRYMAFGEYGEGAEQPELAPIPEPTVGSEEPVAAMEPFAAPEANEELELEYKSAEERAAAAQREQEAQELAEQMQTRGKKAVKRQGQKPRYIAFGEFGQGAEQPELAPIPEPTVGSEQPVASTEPFIAPEESEGEEYKQSHEEKLAQDAADPEELKAEIEQEESA